MRIGSECAMNYADLSKAGILMVAYGNCADVAAVNFFILAFIIFIMVKLINKRKAQTSTAHRQALLLLCQIRDALSARR